jgi:hypothetical protein
MRSAHFAFLLLPLLLNSCQGPKVTVIINELRPGMLKGKTVGIEGMMITPANWPGKGIDAPILCAAEKGLRGGMKGVHIYIMTEEGMVNESAEMKPCEGTSLGNFRGIAAAGTSKTRANQPDYIFRIMLRSDSNSHSSNMGRDFDYMRLRNVGGIGGGYNAFGWNGLSSRGGVSAFGGGSYSWRELTRRTLKADYILSDSQTHKLIWRAEAVAYKVHVNVNNSVAGYRSPADLASEIKLQPLWIAMNTAAERTIKKSGTSSYQTMLLGRRCLIYP